MSWIEEQERILNFENIPQKEPLKTIKAHFFYINKHQYIYKIDTEELSLSYSGNNRGRQEGRDTEEFPLDNPTIPSEKLVQILQSKKIHTANTKYVFQDLYLFHIDLEPTHIQGFVESNDNNYSDKFFHHISITNNLTIAPSISLFHPIIGLYFFFKEIETPHEKRPQPKPILKSTSSTIPTIKKRVTLKILPNNVHRKTKRNLDIVAS